MATHLPFPGSRLECSGVFAHFQRTVFNVLDVVKLMRESMVKLVKSRMWWNQLVRPACSQVASAWPPKVKQTREKVSDPREIFPIMIHEILICCAVRHGQSIQLLFGQMMWDRRVWRAAGRMDNMKAKALNIFHEANTSRLLSKFQHEGCILCKA